MEPLSATRYIDVYLPLRSGVSGDNEEIRLLTDAKGEVRIVVRKHFIDATGRPIPPRTPLYETPTREQLAGESSFECRACHSFHRLNEGHEIQEPPPEVIQVPTPEECEDADDGSTVAVRVPAQGKPRRGFCPKCWKLEKSARRRSFLAGIFLDPIRAMLAGPEKSDPGRQAQLPAPIVLLPNRAGVQGTPRMRNRRMRMNGQDMGDDQR